MAQLDGWKREFKYPCSDQVDCYPQDVILNPGTYIIECYGASGGSSGSGTGGYGAYTSGIIKIAERRRVFLFIGAQGHTILGKTSYNGGGRAHAYLYTESLGASGGGSTDVRLLNNSERSGLLSRIIVAGAGGGGDSFGTGAVGGNAGFLKGGNGNVGISVQNSDEVSLATGGTQVSGGVKSKCISYSGKECAFQGFDGEFGIGGNGTNNNYGGGGGSGYFGGGGGAFTHYHVTSGAGGSSYVSGYQDCHSFVEENGELKDINSPIHSSGLFFTNITFKEGSETKYTGNGKIIITLLEIHCSCRIKRTFISSLVTATAFIISQ